MSFRVKRFLRVDRFLWCECSGVQERCCDNLAPKPFWTLPTLGIGACSPILSEAWYTSQTRKCRTATSAAWLDHHPL